MSQCGWIITTRATRRKSSSVLRRSRRKSMPALSPAMNRSPVRPSPSAKISATCRLVIIRPLPTTKPVPPYGTLGWPGSSIRPIDAKVPRNRARIGSSFRCSQSWCRVLKSPPTMSIAGRLSGMMIASRWKRSAGLSGIPCASFSTVRCRIGSTAPAASSPNDSSTTSSIFLDFVVWERNARKVASSTRDGIGASRIG